MKKQNKRGLTLIELLVVVLIIGILAAIALPQYNKAVQKTRFAEALSNIHALQQAAQAYALAHSELEGTMEITDLDVALTSANFTYTVLWDSGICESGGETLQIRADTEQYSIISELCNNQWSTYCLGGYDYEKQEPIPEGERICAIFSQINL